MSATSSVSSSSSSFHSLENTQNLQTKEGRHRFYHRLVIENLNDEIVSSFIQICGLRSKINLRNEFYSYLLNHHTLDEPLKFISKFDELSKNVLQISRAKGLNFGDEQDLLNGIEDLENGLYDARPDVRIIQAHSKALKQSEEQEEALTKLEENLTKQNEILAEIRVQVTKNGEETTKNGEQITKNGEQIAEIEEQITKNGKQIAKNGEALLRIEEESENLRKGFKDLSNEQRTMAAEIRDIAKQNKETDAQMTTLLEEQDVKMRNLEIRLAALSQPSEQDHVEITIPEENLENKIQKKPGLKERIKLLKIAPNYDVFRDFYSRHQPLIKNICLGVLLLFIVGGITTGIYFKIYV